MAGEHESTPIGDREERIPGFRDGSKRSHARRSPMASSTQTTRTST